MNQDVHILLLLFSSGSVEDADQIKSNYIMQFFFLLL